MRLNTSILPEKHYSLDIIEDVKAICDPFFKSHGIKHFTYFRCHDDGTAYTLISHRALYTHHIKSEYIVAPKIDKSTLKSKFHYFAMPELEDDFSQAVFDYNTLFSIKNPIYLFERYEGYFDLFIYSHTSNKSDSINFFLNNLNILDNFKFYFKDKAKKLIEKSKENKIVLPKHMKTNFGGLKSTEKPEEKSDRENLAKRYSIGNGYEKKYLSARELNTLQYLGKGFTAKQTAKETGLSPRTVESYLANIKHKLGVSKKNEAIKIISDLGLL